MSLLTRNVSVYALPSLNTVFLTQENGDAILTEDGFNILIDNPTYDPNLGARNTSSYELSVLSSISVILAEDGSYLLAEDGTYILSEESGQSQTLSARSSSSYSLLVRN